MNILISVDHSADAFVDELVGFLKSKGLDVNAMNPAAQMHCLNCTTPPVEVAPSAPAEVPPESALPVVDVPAIVPEPSVPDVVPEPSLDAPSEVQPTPQPLVVPPEEPTGLPPDPKPEEVGESTIYNLSLTQPVPTVKDPSVAYSHLKATNVVYDPASSTVTFDYQGFRFTQICGPASDVVNPDHPETTTTIRALVLLPGVERPVACLLDVQQVEGNGNILVIGQDLMAHLGD